MIHPDPHEALERALRSFLPPDRLLGDPLKRLAHGTDASFYRLIPKLVVKTRNESEVSSLLRSADRLSIPVTFRAAGTSLSGQSVTDSVLAIAASGWDAYEILDGGDRVRLQPGLIGARVNRLLAPYGKKIGPDPASINSAMIGGIAANNASGMCCGIDQNSYKTVESLRIVLADGTVVDTGDAASRERFSRSHGHLLSRLSEMARRVRRSPELAGRIRRKFRIKNTTGYSLNALLDFDDPFEIMAHLMIGSEGTLGFLSEITYRTVVEHPHKASALIVFSTIHDASNAAALLRNQPVAAAELMDRAALRSVETKAGMPDAIRGLTDEATALLVETRAETVPDLRHNVTCIAEALDCLPVERSVRFVEGASYDIDTVLECVATELPFRFTEKASEYERLWAVRKGLFPAVGAMRRPGTTVIIEDVAFPIERLAEATLDLQARLRHHGYHEGIIFGHALAGNLHFVFTQDFSRHEEIERYRGFMDDVSEMVVGRFDGSLKAEHGTGRNMAPFVEKEWGAEAYRLMADIKAVFDPKGILNPGVILNDNPDVHLENLKPLPVAHPIIDKCIECGFCEVNCPSRELTLTPRQRIVVQREIARLGRTGEDPARRRILEAGYVYEGERTCAADGLCATSCPVEINTGEHTKALRRDTVATSFHRTAADWVANHFAATTQAARLALTGADGAHRLLGTDRMERLSRAARRLAGGRLPQWSRYMPTAVGFRGPLGNPGPDTVVVFPSCINRAMGPAAGDPDDEPLFDVLHRLLGRAGFSVVYPGGSERLCCGMPFESKGFFEQADRMARALDTALLAASDGGRYPVLCDNSPCLERMRRTLDSRLALFEPVGFAERFLLDRLRFRKTGDTVAVHITCSSRKMGLEPAWHAVAEACSEMAVFPDTVGCCGFAGDRGFHFPELTRAALQPLRGEVAGRCTAAFSNSRTCEIGLSQHSGLYYKSIIYLVDRCTRP